MEHRPLIEHIKNELKNYPHQQFLVGVSGGVDSVVLCYLFKALNISFHMAHINFQLRNDESMRDELFVGALANLLNIPLHIQRVDTQQYAKAKKITIQEAARDIRYTYFEQWRKEYYLHKIVTAHHADDNIETILFRMMRGTGLKGLLGIPKQHKHIFRPLLDISKQEIVAYASTNNIDYVEDSTNPADKYRRNWIRNQLLPIIETQFPNTKSNIQNHLPFWKETYALYEDTINRIFNKKIRTTPQGQLLSIAFLETSPYRNILYFELLQRYQFSPNQLFELQKLATANNGSYMQSHAFKIIKYNKNLIIHPVGEPIFDPILIEKNTTEVFALSDKKLSFKYSEKIPTLFSKDTHIAYLDAEHIHFPLLWRSIKQGDYFYPLGLKKKKKVARFLIDSKVKSPQKEQVTIIEDANKKIIWITGYRIDDRFKISPSTKQCIKIKYETYR